MTPEQIFSKAFHGVMDQGALAQNYGGSCFYQMPDGKRCNAGQLLSEGQLHRIVMAGMNCKRFGTVAAFLGVFENQVEFIKTLQSAHDRADNLDAYVVNMKRIAHVHGWTFPPARLPA